jgi:hypothetical protein
MNKLVTCVYLNLYKTVLGGRPPAFKVRYLNGLVNLKSNSLQKVVYTSSSTLDCIVNFVEKNTNREEFNKYSFKTFELENYKYYKNICNLQQTSKAVSSDRCITLQWSKFDFMNNETNEENEFVFWVDAGLISPVLFPSSVYDKSHLNILSDKYFANLTQNIKEKCYCIAGDRSNGYLHFAPSHLMKLKNFNLHPIGGFFGGRSCELKQALNRYSDLVDQHIRNELLYSEETLLEIDFLNHEHNYFTDSFDSWHHEDTKRYDSTKKQFYKTFLQYK